MQTQNQPIQGNRRYTLNTTLNLRFYQMPQVFFTSDRYRKMSNNAKILFMVMSDRLMLSIQNRWLNDQNEVYFVYPITKLMDITGLSNKTVIKVKKELMEFGLLEEEQTGRANKMYLLQPEISDHDAYDMLKFNSDLDFGKEVAYKNEKGMFSGSDQNTFDRYESRNDQSTLLGRNEEISRNDQSTLLEETATDQPFDQKCNFYTSEVKNFHPNKTNINNTKKEEEEPLKRVREEIAQPIQKSQPATQEPESEKLNGEQIPSVYPEIEISNEPSQTLDPAIRAMLIATGLFLSGEVTWVLKQLEGQPVTVDDVEDQLDAMAQSAQEIHNPAKYFVNGIERRLRLQSFRSHHEVEAEVIPVISLHDWLNGQPA